MERGSGWYSAISPMKGGVAWYSARSSIFHVNFPSHAILQTAIPLFSLDNSIFSIFVFFIFSIFSNAFLIFAKISLISAKNILFTTKNFPAAINSSRVNV